MSIKGWGLFALALVFFSNSVIAGELTAEQYADFPLKNPFLATILSKSAQTSERHTTLKLDFRPERRDVPGLEGKNKLPVQLFIHEGVKAPLVFVVAGTGGASTSGLSLELSGLIYKAGYHVVSLPDPLSQDFILGFSQSALPGYPPRDAREYYEFLKQLLPHLKAQTNMQISSYAIAGYSYGAILSGFLLREDNEQRVFNFTKAILVNPALDLTYGVKVLDDFYLAANAESKSRKSYFNLSLISLILAIKSGLSLDRANSTATAAQISDEEMKSMIGDAFRMKLKKIVFASQQVNDIGVLPTKNKKDAHHRDNDVGQVTFAEYMNDFVLPSLKAEVSDVTQGNIYALTDLLHDDPRITVMENTDDILVKDGDADFLRATLGPRLYLYPYGGHVGNLSFSRNQNDLKQILQSVTD